MINVEQTIISQYGNSATITQLIRGMNDSIDPRADLDAFYNFVWNVETAQGFGLDIWGRIVDIPRTLLIPPDMFNLGFNEAGPQARPFNEAPFYDGVPPTSETYFLSDAAYRQLILVKALSNISACDAPTLNRLLQNLFGDRGRCYVNDLGGMALRYVFEFALTAYEFAIITQSGALPRPAGVQSSMFNSELPLFGFSEAGASAAPFGQGVFISQGATYATI
jgi:hypothetical protein